MRINAGSAKGRLLKSPRNSKVRPTADKVKSAFFNIIGNAVGGGVFLDLFAGTGNIGIEALSRGAGRCVFVDKDRSSLKLIKENLHLAGFAERALVLGYDVIRALQILKKKEESFNVIYIDPPYFYSRIAPILETVSVCGLLIAGGYIGVERNSRDHCPWLEDIPFQVRQQKVYGNTRLILLHGTDAAF
ncbi:MAG: 16S rRNA (guanine(966)-N(2))-methyltransferase RsmD [Bacillota bacterium]